MTGVLCGPSGGAALYPAVQWCAERAARESTVVVILADSAEGTYHGPVVADRALTSLADPGLSNGRCHRVGGVGVWYASDQEQASWAELMRHFVDDGVDPFELRRRVGRVKVDRLQVLDLTDPAARAAVGGSRRPIWSVTTTRRRRRSPPRPQQRDLRGCSPHRPVSGPPHACRVRGRRVGDRCGVVCGASRRPAWATCCPSCACVPICRSRAAHACPPGGRG